MTRRKALLNVGARVAPVDAQIGARIRAFRQSRKISQTTLGEHLGVTFQQIQKYERGTNRISGSSLVKLCDVLQVKAEQILGNGHGVFHNEPDVLEALQDKSVSTMLVELHRLPKSQRQALLEILQIILSAFLRV